MQLFYTLASDDRAAAMPPPPLPPPVPAAGAATVSAAPAPVPVPAPFIGPCLPPSFAANRPDAALPCDSSLNDVPLSTPLQYGPSLPPSFQRDGPVTAALQPAASPSLQNEVPSPPQSDASIFEPQGDAMQPTLKAPQSQAPSQVDAALPPPPSAQPSAAGPSSVPGVALPVPGSASSGRDAAAEKHGLKRMAGECLESTCFVCMLSFLCTDCFSCRSCVPRPRQEAVGCFQFCAWLRFVGAPKPFRRLPTNVV